MKNRKFIFVCIILISHLLSCNAKDFNSGFIISEEDNDTIRVRESDELDYVLKNRLTNTTIRIDSGVYNMKAQVLTNLRDVVIQGDTKDVTILSGIMKISLSNNIVLRDIRLRFSGFSYNKYILRLINSKNIILDNVTFEMASTNALELIESSVMMEGCVIRRSGQNGIVAVKSSVVYIKDSEIIDNGKYGFACTNSIFKIEKSRLYKNTKHNLMCASNSTGAVSDSFISNSLEGNGIAVSGSKLNLTNNQIINNHEYGIEYINSKGIIRKGHSSFNSGGMLIKNSSLQIEKATFENNENNGMNFENSFAVLRSIKVAGTNNGTGAYIKDSEVNIVKSVFHLNKDHGIYYENSTGSVISTLSSFSKEQSGLYSKNSILKISLSYFEKNQNDGIWLTDNSDITVINTKSLTNKSDGIEAKSSKLTIENSSAVENQDYGIRADQSTIIIKDTDLKDNEKGSISNIDDSSKITSK